MTYRDRSPYAVLPDLRGKPRPFRVPIEDVRPAFDLGGLRGVEVLLRDLIRPHVEGRASTSAEVQLLHEWLDVEVEDGLRYWRARLIRHANGEHLDEDQADAEEHREKPEEPAAERVTCSACGSLFERPVGAIGRPRSRCWRCYPPRSGRAPSSG